MNIIESISPIDYNRARFIVYNINNTFRIYFKNYIKKKKKISKTFCVQTTYLENCIEYSVQHIRLNNGKKYVKLGAQTLEKNILIEPIISYLSEMNKLTEISNKMIITKVRFILINTELLKKF